MAEDGIPGGKFDDFFFCINFHIIILEPGQKGVDGIMQVEEGQPWYLRLLIEK